MTSDSATRSRDLQRLITCLAASGIPYSDETFYSSDVEGVLLHDPQPPGEIVYEVLVLPTESTRYLYRFNAGYPGFCPRTELAFDDLDNIIDVIKRDLAAYAASDRSGGDSQ